MIVICNNTGYYSHLKREWFSSVKFVKRNTLVPRSISKLWMVILLINPLSGMADCQQSGDETKPDSSVACRPLENVTILGVAQDRSKIAGAATLIDASELEAFATVDVSRALRRVPGTSLQAEDGYGLRPNISIRGTPSERSSRITLLEDNVLIAPAPYAAPAAYYFPSFGRINSVEVLKGPAAISQGPYTIGGALNLLSTPIPDRQSGQINMEAGSDNSWRTHAWYGNADTRVAWMVETQLWKSDGYQEIDRSKAGTGLDKSDYLAKFRISSDPASNLYQYLDIKLQSSGEDSGQSYLGLSDQDFRDKPIRRYGLSALDQLHNTHDQIVLSWHIEPFDGLDLFVTAYNNNTARAWYKTEGIDFDGSENSSEFDRTSWSSVINAINSISAIDGLSSESLQAILDGADTLPGSIQIRNNAREYYSKGIQAGGNRQFDSGDAIHNMKFGIRMHRDQEDRMQRNDTYQQLEGALSLNDVGLQGNAGNRIQQAKAWSIFIQDRIELGRWTITPGLRYENIEQTRIDFGADPANPSGRAATDVKSSRQNSEDFWLPGVGVLFGLNDQWSLIAGVHKGFSAPGDKQGVEAEESINYETGFRFQSGDLNVEAIAFFQDYRNLQGICTASSGTGCEIGDVFNGQAVSIPGLEFTLAQELAPESSFSMPLQISYTWMDARFDSNIEDSKFFGDVVAGDPVPYIPDQQLFVSLGFEFGPWAAYLSGSYVDSVCTVASCGAFQKTDSSTIFDLGVHYRLNNNLELFTVMENLTAQLDIAGRQPYGARPGKDRSWLLGARIDF
jgi:Fe(3+) dicitrate transport protein